MLTRWVLPAVLLPCLLCVRAYAQAPQVVSSPPQKKRLTFTLKYTPIFFENVRQIRPAVTGSFANYQQALFTIDTGTDGIIAGEKLVISLGILPFPNKDPFHGISINGNPLKQFILPDYDMETSSPSSPLSNGNWLRRVVVNGLTNVEPKGHTNLFEADGILGTSVLNNLGAVLFDGPKQEVTFVLGGNLTATEREQLGFSSSAASVELTPRNWDASGAFTIPVMLKNNFVTRQVNLLADTGSTVTTIPSDSAMALGLKSVYTSNLTSLAGKQKIEHASVEMLKVGSLILHDVPVSYFSRGKEVPEVQQAKSKDFDTFGMDIMAGYRVLFDFPARVMYLMPSQPEVKIITK